MLLLLCQNVKSLWPQTILLGLWISESLNFVRFWGELFVNGQADKPCYQSVNALPASLSGFYARVGVRVRCRITPPRFLAECHKRRLNQGSFVSTVCLVVYFLWFVLCLCVYFCDLHSVFFLIVSLSVTVKWLTVKTAPKMTYTVSGGALNSTQSNPTEINQFCQQLEEMEHSFVSVLFQLCQQLNACYILSYLPSVKGCMQL